MAEKLAELNNRPLSADSTQTRASLFAEHEKPKLKKLPSEPFEIGRWQRFKLGSDYHVCINGVAYSAPFGLIGKPVDVHCTASLIGIFHQGERPAPEAPAFSGKRGDAKASPAPIRFAAQSLACCAQPSPSTNIARPSTGRRRGSRPRQCARRWRPSAER